MYFNVHLISCSACQYTIYFQTSKCQKMLATKDSRILMNITNSLDNSWMMDCLINTVQGTTILSSQIYPRFKLRFSFCTKEQTNTQQFAYPLSGNIYLVGCIRQTSKYLLQPTIIFHWFINNYINFNANFQQMAICLATAITFMFQMHSTQLSSHLGATTNVNVSSTTHLTFSHDEQTPTLEQFIYIT